ncbi:unnamed protein product, partial [Lepidochelys olivacea]
MGGLSDFCPSGVAAPETTADGSPGRTKYSREKCEMPAGHAALVGIQPQIAEEQVTFRLAGAV